MPPSELPPAPDRRRFLGALGSAALGAASAARAAAAGGAAAWGAAASGCAPEPTEPPTLAVPLAQLPPGRRLVVVVGETPVELSRDPDGVVTARSLLCTHQGCTVEWNGTAREYRCPCHDARFDAAGRPLFGPATRPLALVPVELTADSVVVRPPRGDAG